MPTSEEVACQECQHASQHAGPAVRPADDTRSPCDSLPRDKVVTRLPPVPDLNNQRFCRACEASLPVEAFQRGKRRYLCRRCDWLRNKKPYVDRAHADPHQKLLRLLWKRGWEDAKNTFKHLGVSLVLKDIETALVGQNAPRGQNARKSDIALVPQKPTQLLSRDNLAVVEKNARRQLLRAYRQGGETEYVSALAQLD
jgi:hypothetical protein